MRLIDADELITAFPCGESVRTESVRATINHMPTIEVSEDCISKHDIWKIIEDNAYWVRYNENSTEKGMTLTGINQALNECPPVIPTVSEDCIYTYCSRCGMRVVVDAPSVVPNRAEGEWKFKKIFPNDDSEFPMGYLVCSVCGSQHANATPCNYCDNCGSRMKGMDNGTVKSKSE